MSTQIQFVFLSLFILESFSLNSTQPNIPACGLRAVNFCLSKYIQGFTDPQFKDVDEVTLHCTLDMNLAKCADSCLYGCPSGILESLGRAVLSYARFDRQLGVCRWRGFQKLANKLLSNDVNVKWIRKYDRMAYSCNPTKCAKIADIYCIRAFVSKMRGKPDLCEFIPFKSDCLKKIQYHCQANILDAVLDIFPEEANNVLEVLCQKKKE